MGSHNRSERASFFKDCVAEVKNDKLADGEKASTGVKWDGWKVPNQVADNIKEVGNGLQASILMQGVVNNENLDWLNRSVIGALRHPVNIEISSNRLYSSMPTVSKIIDIGKYRVLMVFTSKKDMKAALSTLWIFLKKIC